jgi:hypothetical protein
LLLQRIEPLDKNLWQHTLQHSQNLVQVCQLCLDEDVMMNMQAMQQTLQRLTYSLADAFAA